MDYPNFVGGAYTSKAIEVDSEDLLNMYVETQEVPGAKAPIVLYGSPGTYKLLTVGSGPIRGQLDTEGFTDVVSGSEYFRIDPAGNVVHVGDVATDGKPISMVANTTQLLIVSAGVAYVSDGAGFSAVPSPPWTSAADCAFLNGFFIVLDDNGLPVGGDFFIAADARVWDPLDFSNAPSSNNKLRALATTHDELWIFGTVVTQVFYDNGGADFPFVPNQTGIIQQGIEAKSSRQSLNNTLYWLGRNQEGALRAFTATGYTPVPISTYPLQQAWFKYSNPEDAVGWTAQIEGHLYYHLNFLTAQKSWRFDQTTNLWHRIAFRNPITNADECHRGNNHGVRSGLHIVGDRETGDIWVLDPNTYADGDNPLVALRAAPFPWQGGKIVFFPIFELITPGGIGDGSNLNPDNGTVTPEANPAWMLDWSNDSGHTYGPQFMLHAGAQGEYTARVRKVGCGSGRNRVMRVSFSANRPRCIIGAELPEGVIIGTS